MKSVPLSSPASLSSASSSALLSAVHRWTVDPSGHLTPVGSIGSPTERFSPAVSFEELAGLAVQRVTPVVWQDPKLGGAVLALPVVDRDRVTAAISMALSYESSAAFGLEIWSGRSDRFELSLTDSVYHGLGRFTSMSPYLNFPKGSGLPGQAWEKGAPIVLDEIGKHPDFLRATGAIDAGLKTGLALPVVKGIGLQAVTLLLSGSNPPIAPLMEVWHPTVRGENSVQLQCASGAYVGTEALQRAASRTTIPAGVSWIGAAWATRMPVLVDGESEHRFHRKDAAEADGLTHGLALPIIVLDDVRAVAVFGWSALA